MADHRRAVPDYFPVKFNRKTWTFSRKQLVELPQDTVIRHWSWTLYVIDRYVVITYNANPNKCAIISQRLRDSAIYQSEGGTHQLSAGWGNHADYPLKREKRRAKKLSKAYQVFQQKEETNGSSEEINEYSYRECCEITPRNRKSWRQQVRELAER